MKLDTHGKKRVFGNAILAANGKAIRATFQQADGTNAMSYGLMEIPFSDAPPREVTLIKDAPEEDEASAYYFQVAISHDGKTAAVASTYLACTREGVQPGRLRPVPRGPERPEVEGDQSADSHAGQASPTA